MQKVSLINPWQRLPGKKGLLKIAIAVTSVYYVCQSFWSLQMAMAIYRYSCWLVGHYCRLQLFVSASIVSTVLFDMSHLAESEEGYIELPGEVEMFRTGYQSLRLLHTLKSRIISWNDHSLGLSLLRWERSESPSSSSPACFIMRSAVGTALPLGRLAMLYSKNSYLMLQKQQLCLSLAGSSWSKAS